MIHYFLAFVGAMHRDTHNIKKKNIYICIYIYIYVGVDLKGCVRGMI